MILIASYPKSGNTWVRAVLSAYFSENQQLDIRKIGGLATLSNRTVLDEMMGVTSADLPNPSLSLLRQKFCAELQKREAPNAYYKVHDAYTPTGETVSIFPAAAVKRAIYILRNPLNIAPSYADHQDWSIDAIIDFMCDPTARLYYQNHFSFSQLEQFLGTWAHHVSSWTSQTEIPLTVIRYEDLCQEPTTTFAKILAAFTASPDTAKLEKAIATCSLSNLKEQEASGGFPERNPRVDTFFQKGADRDWRTELTQDQAKKLQTAFHETMEQFGYV